MAKKYRVCITRCGYAEVEAENEQLAMDEAQRLSEHDFDWERVDAGLINDTGEIVEQII